MTRRKIAVAYRKTDRLETIKALVRDQGADCLMLVPEDLLQGRRESWSDVVALVVDVDAFPPAEDYFARLAGVLPHIRVVALSKGTSHPEFKVAMRDNIFSCIREPFDAGELAFCLRSIVRAEEKRRADGARN